MKHRQFTFFFVLFIFQLSVHAAPLGTAFTYQGELQVDGAAANGTFDFQVELFDADTGGMAVGSPLVVEDVAVMNGIFSIPLDFTAAPFAGDQLWLEIAVRDGASTGGFTGLLPRQTLTATPYALHAEMVAVSAIGSTEVANNSLTAADLAPNSVGTSEVANNSLTASDLAPNSVGTSEVADDSLTADDLGANSVGAAEVNAGEVQRRVTGACPAGEFMQSVGEDGAVACQSNALASGQVTTVEILNGTILSEDIAAGAVGPTQVNSSGSYVFSNVEVSNDLDTRGLTVTGETIIDSVFDIRIQDDFNGFRWFNTAGDTQLAAIEVRATDTSFQDVARNRRLIHSNDNGIGIGTSSPSAGFDVTIPSLIVTDTLDVGLERVTATYQTNLMSANCHAHGNLPCYYGSATVSCPVGKKALGGGSTGASGLFGSLAFSFPNSDTSWQCGVSYDIADANRTCYVLCARLD